MNVTHVFSGVPVADLPRTEDGNQIGLAQVPS